MNLEDTISGRVCVVSHRLGGYDGVSVEAAKWEAGFQALGWEVTRAAGFFVDHRATDVVIAGMWADRPGGDPPPVDHRTIQHVVGSHDLLVLDNAGSLWSAPKASLAWESHALAAGVPTILRHHDPPFQGTPLRPITDGSVPLHDVRHLHVVINRFTYGQFDERWPELPGAGALRVAHNRVDVDELATGDRDRTRAELGVDRREILLAHPARADERKNVPGAVEFALELADRVDRPVRYWLTDPAAPLPDSLQRALDRAPGLIRGHVARQADLYAAADVVLLPSAWEGWGLPVVEAAAARRIVVAGPYPMLEEIRGFGLRVHDPAEVDTVAALLEDRQKAAELLESNRAAVREHCDLRFLPAELADLAATARRLAGSPAQP
ncbi:MAG TPA: glycosyltransferase [Pseudonocardia sp.]|nr:glycosyltransferase [Pseudonocardia sp.]